MSNLCVKMMSGEGLPDEDSTKGFTLVEAFGEVICERDEEGRPRISIPREDEEHPRIFFPQGNTYLLKNGKTVATFSYSSHKLALEKICKEEGRKAQEYLANGSCAFNPSDFDNLQPTLYFITLPHLERVDAMLFVKGHHYSRLDSFLHPDIGEVMSVYKQVPTRPIQVNRQDILALYATESSYDKRPNTIILSPEIQMSVMSNYTNVVGTNVWNSTPDLDTVNDVGFKLTHNTLELGEVINVEPGSLVVHSIDIPNITEETYDNMLKRIDGQMCDADFVKVGAVLLRPSDKHKTNIYRKN